MTRTTGVLAACAGVLLAGCAAPAVPTSPGPVGDGTAPVAPTPAAVTAPPAPTPSSPAPQAPTPAPRATQDAAAAPAGVLAVGDSVMLGSKPLLRRSGVRTVDAVVGRQFGSAVSIVERAAARGSLPRNVVVHLGTNGTVTLKACKGVVRHAGPERKVFLVTVRVPRAWQDSNNRTLRRCAAAYGEDRAEVVDWSAYSAGHPGWFGADRVHPTPAGRSHYTSLIERAVESDGI
jgi:hypothetical protein